MILALMAIRVLGLVVKGSSLAGMPGHWSLDSVVILLLQNSRWDVAGLRVYLSRVLSVQKCAEVQQD